MNIYSSEKITFVKHRNPYGFRNGVDCRLYVKDHNSKQENLKDKKYIYIIFLYFVLLLVLGMGRCLLCLTCLHSLFPKGKLGRVVHLDATKGTYSLFIYLYRLGCSLGDLQVVWPDKFCQAKHLEGENITYIYTQDMELFMTKISHISTKY